MNKEQSKQNGMRDGLWLLPTRRRLQLLARFFEAAQKTGMSTGGLVLVQKEEFAELADAYKAITLPDGWEYVVTEGDGMGDKMREMWERTKDLDWVGIMVDDMVPMTNGWDQLLLDDLDGTNVVSANDGYRAPHRLTTAVWSGELLRAVGYLYPAGLWHTFIDDLWESLGRATNCWQVRMDVLIKHEDAFQTGKYDETHHKGYNRMGDDQVKFQEWVKNESADALQRIIALKEIHRAWHTELMQQKPSALHGGKLLGLGIVVFVFGGITFYLIGKLFS